jgi:hypothetical protein
MGFCSVIFLGNSDLYAASQPLKPFSLMPLGTLSPMPPWIETYNGTYRVVKKKIDGILRRFVEQKYEFGTNELGIRVVGIIRWETDMPETIKIAFLKQFDNPHSQDKDPTKRRTRGIRHFTLEKKPKELKEALEKCRDADDFIDCHPDLLLQFIAKWGHLGEDDEDYLKIIDLLVDFGYHTEEHFLFVGEKAQDDSVETS